MFTWSQDKNDLLNKNDLLKRYRGVAFEDVAIKVLQRDIVGIEYDHNPVRYPGQHLLMVTVRGYLYSVPYYQIYDETRHFVTAYPDSKRMKRYGSERG